MNHLSSRAAVRRGVCVAAQTALPDPGVTGKAGFAVRANAGPAGGKLLEVAKTKSAHVALAVAGLPTDARTGAERARSRESASSTTWTERVARRRKDVSVARMDADPKGNASGREAHASRGSVAATPGRSNKGA